MGVRVSAQHALPLLGLARLVLLASCIARLLPRMLGRWLKLQQIFADASIFRLTELEAPRADAFSGQATYAPSPAYAWVELTDASLYEGSALKAMASVGIVGRAGTEFGASALFVRLEPIMPHAATSRLRSHRSRRSEQRAYGANSISEKLSM